MARHNKNITDFARETFISRAFCFFKIKTGVNYAELNNDFSSLKKIHILTTY